MTENGYVLSDMPRLMKRGQPLDLLNARAVLLDAAEQVITVAAAESRALKPEERQAFDGYSAEIQSINGQLAEYKRQRTANASEDGPPNFPF